MLKRQFLYIEKQKTPADEIALCIRHCEDEANKSLIGVTIFINTSDDADFFAQRNRIQNAFDEHFGNLPVSVVSQPPLCSGTAVEIWTNSDCRNLVHKRWCGLNYTVYEDSFGKSIWGFGASANDPVFSFREQAHHSFEMMQAVLSAEGFAIDDLVRQWNYIPQILRTSEENNRIYQNYQLFNDIRQYYYGIYKRNSQYPAATGIGMDCGTVTIDFHAVQKQASTQIAGLNNPNQTDAYHYGQEVLVGSPLKENETKKAPLFERAKYIGNTQKGLVFVSGTASITGEKTIGLNDTETQTDTTIRNISELTSETNLKQAGIAIQEKRYDYLRVYIKNLADAGTVMKICRERYGDIPVLYVKADVCRDDLLVEIEGEAEL
jgi:enamine deaminase RidA (YjgF/YER057c/UK114 family)